MVYPGHQPEDPGGASGPRRSVGSGWAPERPTGYRKDEQDRKKLVVDEEAAAVVRRIFALCAAGQGPSQIARC